MRPWSENTTMSKLSWNLTSPQRLRPRKNQAEIFLRKWIKKSFLQMVAIIYIWRGFLLWGKTASPRSLSEICYKYYFFFYFSDICYKYYFFIFFFTKHFFFTFSLLFRSLPGGYLFLDGGYVSERREFISGRRVFNDSLHNKYPSATHCCNPEKQWLLGGIKWKMLVQILSVVKNYYMEWWESTSIYLLLAGTQQVWRFHLF